MRSLDSYLDEYAESHRHPTNKSIHNIAVPLIMWSLLGFLHTFAINGSDFRLSYVLIIASLLYYASFKRPLVLISMGLVTAVMVASFSFVLELRIVSLVVFFLSWAAQFYGHKLEGKKPSFFKDLLFLLIGPVWVMSKVAPFVVSREKAT